jgi:DNA-binding MurR/RpiR family transcriptional regulator
MVLAQIRDHLPQLSVAKQNVGAYILSNWQEVAFLTITQLARAVNVSDSVVVRFAHDIGFSGYPQLQEEIRNLVKQELGLVDMYRRSADEEDGNKTRRLIDRVLANDVDNLTRTLESLDLADVEKAVDLIAGAREIALLGTRSSAGPALICALYLNSILRNARFYNNNFGDLFDQLRTLGEDDVVIAISFAWYTQQTISALEYCRERGARAISITDSQNSPLVALSDVSLIARPEGVSFYLSQVSTLGIVNILLYLVANRTRERSEGALEEMQEVYSRFIVPPGGRRGQS